VLPPDPPNPAVVRQLIRRAQARLRAMRRRMSEKASGAPRILGDGKISVDASNEWA
jgi:hypothetical protein